MTSEGRYAVQMSFPGGRTQLVQSLPDLLLAPYIIHQFRLSPVHLQLAAVRVVTRLPFVIRMLASHLNERKVTKTEAERLVRRAGRYQKMKGMMKCGNISEMFCTVRMYNSSPDVTVMRLVSSEHMISSLP